VLVQSDAVKKVVDLPEELLHYVLRLLHTGYTNREVLGRTPMLRGDGRTHLDLRLSPSQEPYMGLTTPPEIHLLGPMGAERPRVWLPCEY